MGRNAWDSRKGRTRGRRCFGSLHRLKLLVFALVGNSGGREYSRLRPAIAEFLLASSSMADRPDDICPRSEPLAPQPTRPAVSPIHLATVWQCESSEQANQLLTGKMPGYVYRRDGHPNADLLANKCRQLHRAERASITSSGMSALAAALLSQVEAGDHVIVSNKVYGGTLQLLAQEARRIGIASTVADTNDLTGLRAAFTPRTRFIVVETISNPTLCVADVPALAELAHRHGAKLLVDNTFASPIVCRPLELGADVVMESMTKIMNGHSDVMLGLLCGPNDVWSRIPAVITTWGFASSPFDCWLAERGLATAHLRIDRACQNAQATAEFLAGRSEVSRVDYPGLPVHPQHELACRQFQGGFGSIVTFHLNGGASAADAFISRATRVPFCPSLGELSTTLSHPASTSHRGLSLEARAALGIDDGTIRLSIGIESPEFVISAIAEGL